MCYVIPMTMQGGFSVGGKGGSMAIKDSVFGGGLRTTPQH